MVCRWSTLRPAISEIVNSFSAGRAAPGPRRKRRCGTNLGTIWAVQAPFLSLPGPCGRSDIIRPVTVAMTGLPSYLLDLDGLLCALCLVREMLAWWPKRLSARPSPTVHCRRMEGSDLSIRISLPPRHYRSLLSNEKLDSSYWRLYMPLSSGKIANAKTRSDRAISLCFTSPSPIL